MVTKVIVIVPLSNCPVVEVEVKLMRAPYSTLYGLPLAYSVCMVMTLDTTPASITCAEVVKTILMDGPPQPGARPRAIISAASTTPLSIRNNTPLAMLRSSFNFDVYHYF
jgi:hypothetical protein